MAFKVGSSPFLKISLDGKALDPVEYAITECTTVNADNEAGMCTLGFGAEGVASAIEWPEGAKLKLEYGSDGKAYGTWEGTLESYDPSFGPDESVSLNFYGPSFRLRDGNAPETFKQRTIKDAAERLIRKFGATPIVRINGPARDIALKHTTTAWEALEAIARRHNAIVAERGAQSIYVGPKPEQEFVLEFWYRDAPDDLTPTVLDFQPHWTRRRRLKKVTVVGVDTRSHKRYEGVWEFKPGKYKIEVITTSDEPAKTVKGHYTRSYTRRTKSGEVTQVEGHWVEGYTLPARSVTRKRKRTITIQEDETRQTEITLFLSVRSKAEADKRAQTIGLRNDARTRTATLRVPLAPVDNGDIVRVYGDNLGRFAGSYYVTKVTRDHLALEMTLELEFIYDA